MDMAAAPQMLDATFIPPMPQPQQQWGSYQMPNPPELMPVMPTGMMTMLDAQQQGLAQLNQDIPAESYFVRGFHEAFDYWINTRPSLEQIMAYQQQPNSQ